MGHLCLQNAYEVIDKFNIAVNIKSMQRKSQCRDGHWGGTG